MIRVHAITSAAQAKAYYQVADYYTNGVETVGRAGGLLADRLGVGGRELTAEEFGRLCDNLHPLTGERLTARTNDFRRVGYDMTFSAPKGFSILTAFAGEADRESLRAAFDAAVLETMTGFVEPEMKCRVRLDGEDRDRLTGNMIFDRFYHSTSRPVADAAPDMHEHQHVLCWNATYDPIEDRIKAGQFGDLKRDAEFTTAVFYSKLAAKVEALGFAVERRGGKEWGIAGISRGMEAKFSKRTGEVEDEHADRLANDADYRPGNKVELGAKTRSKKNKELTRAELRADWDGQLSEAERHELAAVYRREADGSGAVTPREAVEFAIAHCSEQLSVIPEKELVRVALLHGLGDVTAEGVRAEMTRQGVIVAEIDGRAMATTEALQREEGYLIGLASPGRGVVPVGMPEGFGRGSLNDGQYQAVCGLLESANRVELIEGPAGAGKTSLLAAYDRAMVDAGHGVTYLATTAKAKDVLQKDGFDAHTLARFLVDERMQEAAKGGRVVIDETSMLGHKDAVRLFKLAEQKDLKLVCVGDPMQHGSVPRGAFHKLMAEHAHIRPFKLTEIMRQHDDGYRAAAKLLSEGRTLDGFDAIDRQGWVKEIGGDAERYGCIAAEYAKAVADKKSVLVVSPTHAEAAKIVDAIRAELKAAGRIVGKEREVTRLVAMGASEAERGQATTYRRGEVLIFHQNAKGHGKGERLTVGDPAAVPLGEAAQFQLYRAEAISLAKGDTIRFTGSVPSLGDKKHRYSNGMVRGIDGFDRSGNIRLDDGRVIAGDAGLIRHAVVETSFGSQGQTVDRVILGMAAESTGAMNQEQLYVSATRGRQSVTIYTDDKDEVRRSVERSSKKLVALDLAAERPKPEPAATEAKRSKLEDDRGGKLRMIGLGRVRDAWEREAAAALAATRAASVAEWSRQQSREASHGFGR